MTIPKKTQTLMAALLTAAFVGCEVPEVETVDVPTPPPTAAAEAEPEPQAEEGFLPDGRLDMSGVPDEPPMTSAVPRPVTAKDPLKGKRSRRAGGYLGTTVGTLPWAENEILFIKIKSDLEVYNAMNGDYPQSHEDFMEKFLPQSVQTLPKLEPGDEYLYDPEDNTLKIWRPGDAG
ncbi:MAG: hypothetical protein AAGA92_08725 [Planctomycetota bacterium]